MLVQSVQHRCPLPASAKAAKLPPFISVFSPPASLFYCQKREGMETEFLLLAPYHWSTPTWCKNICIVSPPICIAANHACEQLASLVRSHHITLAQLDPSGRDLWPVTSGLLRWAITLIIWYVEGEGEKALSGFHKGKVSSPWSKGRSLVQPRC